MIVTTRNNRLDSYWAQVRDCTIYHRNDFVSYFAAAHRYNQCKVPNDCLVRFKNPMPMCEYCTMTHLKMLMMIAMARERYAEY